MLSSFLSSRKSDEKRKTSQGRLCLKLNCNTEFDLAVKTHFMGDKRHLLAL